jgi:hypothetical protein
MYVLAEDGANGCNPIQASKKPILVSESTPKQGKNLHFFASICRIHKVKKPANQSFAGFCSI